MSNIATWHNTIDIQELIVHYVSKKTQTISIILIKFLTLL